MRVMNKSIWPYQVKIEDDQYVERLEWLQENLYHGGHYEPNWYINGPTYCFKDEKEYFHFVLRWMKDQ